MRAKDGPGWGPLFLRAIARPLLRIHTVRPSVGFPTLRYRFPKIRTQNDKTNLYYQSGQSPARVQSQSGKGIPSSERQVKGFIVL